MYKSTILHHFNDFDVDYPGRSRYLEDRTGDVTQSQKTHRKHASNAIKNALVDLESQRNSWQLCLTLKCI